MNKAVPTRIDVSRADGTMTIAWRDGGVSQLSLALLRRACPCAVCEGRREASDDLHMITSGEMSATDRISRIDRVGRYAVQITWEDGHDSGIYTYDYLKGLG